LIAAGGCSDQPQSTAPSKSSGQKSGDAKNSIAKLVDTKPTDAKPADAKPSESSPADVKPAPSKPVSDEKEMSVTKEAYGKLPNGTQIDQYILTNPNGLKVKLINYGAIITSVETPDRNGKIENITLHRDSLQDYMEMKNGKSTTPYFGATV